MAEVFLRLQLIWSQSVARFSIALRYRSLWKINSNSGPDKARCDHASCITHGRYPCVMQARQVYPICGGPSDQQL